MARSMIKSWSDKKPFVRRVRWYSEDANIAKSPVFMGRNIRLCFEDETGKQNVLYGDDVDKAHEDWVAFRAGTLMVEQIRGRR